MILKTCTAAVDLVSRIHRALHLMQPSSFVSTQAFTELDPARNKGTVGIGRGVNRSVDAQVVDKDWTSGGWQEPADLLLDWDLAIKSCEVLCTLGGAPVCVQRVVFCSSSALWQTLTLPCPLPVCFRHPLPIGVAGLSFWSSSLPGMCLAICCAGVNIWVRFSVNDTLLTSATS